MKHNEEILAVVFDYLKILFKDENQGVFDFLDMIKNALFKKIKAKEQTRDFMDKLIENVQKDKEMKKEVRKEILEDLLKNDEDEDEDVKIYCLIELLVAKNKSNSVS